MRAVLPHESQAPPPDATRRLDRVLRSNGWVDDRPVVFSWDWSPKALSASGAAWSEDESWRVHVRGCPAPWESEWAIVHEGVHLLIGLEHWHRQHFYTVAFPNYWRQGIDRRFTIERESRNKTALRVAAELGCEQLVHEISSTF